MEMKPRIAPALEMGLMKASAALQAPEVSLSPWNAVMPVLCIEEGGVVLELEFPDADAFERFQKRVASLRIPEECP